MGDVVPLFSDAPVDLKAWQLHHPAAVHHSQTSMDAGRSMIGKRAHALDVVYKLLQHQPMTDEEIARVSGLNPSTARPRRIELERMGLIEPCGTAQTASGRQAQRWQATLLDEGA